MGIGATAFSQYENGIRLSLDAAIKIANKVPGLTVDYLVRGREEGLPVELRRRIEAASEKEGS
jgi:transcriptional regulator with XRE-family HTH domain